METGTLRIVEGQYLRDILDQPHALAATLERLEIPESMESLRQGLRTGRFKRVVLTGMGASFYALHPLFLRLNAFGYTAVAIETSELIHSLANWLEPESLVIAVSQSGQSAETVRLLEQNRRRAEIVGITNAADSALATDANACLITLAGKEFSVSCKTYVTALMALYRLGEFLCGSEEGRARAEMERMAPAVESYLAEWKEHVYRDRGAGPTSG